MRRMVALASHDKVRFILAGASTTAVSYLLYVLLLLLYMDAKPAYALSYALGIVWSYSVNTVWVFHRTWTWRGLLSFPLVYVVQAGLSFLLFALLIDRWSLPELVAPLVIIVLMLPLTYVLGRAVIHRTSPPAHHSSGDTPP